MATSHVPATTKRPAIFITGAGAGIGRATAERFAKAGWFVGLYDVDESSVRSLQQQLGPQACHAGVLDVTSVPDWHSALAAFWQASGQRMDVLFNNAGIAVTGAFEDSALARHQRLVEVNLLGVLNGCHSALPWLRQTPGSRVVNMCSASALYGQPMLSSYSATKAAVRSFTEALDLEWWSRHRIRVLDVLPLFVDTAMVRDEVSKMKTVQALGVRLSADDVARTVWAIAASRSPHRLRVHWPVGWQTRLLMMSMRCSPERLTRWVTGRMGDL